MHGGPNKCNVMHNRNSLYYCEYLESDSSTSHIN